MTYTLFSYIDIKTQRPQTLFSSFEIFYLVSKRTFVFIFIFYISALFILK